MAVLSDNVGIGVLEHVWLFLFPDNLFGHFRVSFYDTKPPGA